MGLGALKLFYQIWGAVGSKILRSTGLAVYHLNRDGLEAGPCFTFKLPVQGSDQLDHGV